MKRYVKIETLPNLIQKHEDALMVGRESYILAAKLIKQIRGRMRREKLTMVPMGDGRAAVIKDQMPAGTTEAMHHVYFRRFKIDFRTL